MGQFFTPNIEVGTARLRGWSMLGVCLLPAFTHLGHECQDRLSPCDGMHVGANWTSVVTLIRKSFAGMESEPLLTPKEKNLLTGGSEEGRNRDAASRRTASPTHYRLSCPGPR